ncbi:hypothetical protein SLEP1_g21470 [Rubroshorea leprosula]|uniref:RNase H type-1 domain-containing protein n=1 Tax=Rubroshorea leprosula TaxID=152421 RepID=A0AAV5J964_9ROSI|nr:hypothetical protein SLEP1_g21470 [Rubroshorea leprosula]
MWGIGDGLLKAKQLNIQNLIVEMDTLVAFSSSFKGTESQSSSAYLDLGLHGNIGEDSSSSAAPLA